MITHQLIAGAGLAAIMAFCGYMLTQIDVAQGEQAPDVSPVTLSTP